MNEVTVLTGPTVVYAHNPLDHVQRRVFKGEAGLSIRQLRPKVAQPIIVMWNGHFVLPEDEEYVPQPTDHLLYLVMPLGAQVSQQVLGLVLIVVGVFTDNPYLVASGVGLLVTGLVPIPKTNTPLQSSLSSSPTYNIGLAGNSARVGQSIPVLYGRHILLPDFACQPYTEYSDSNDQYYFAIMCLGQLRTGQFTLESVQIDDTDLSHFVDVSTLVGVGFYPPDSPIYGPGITYGLVNPCVVTNTAVANNVLSNDSVVGPFSVCGPGQQCKSIGIDIVCPKGLYFANDSGGLSPVTVNWMVEVRPIDDYNNPTGIWTLLGTHSLTQADSTPVRRSYHYQMTTFGRFEVRVHRLEAESTDSRYGDEVQWTGLRAYLVTPAPMEPTAMYLQLKMKADSQLSGLSQRQISVVIQRWLPTWNPSTGWSAPVYTRSPAWAAVDILRNGDYGPAIDDSRIDLQSFYDLDQECRLRGDTCNVVFDTRITIWAALQTVLATCRSHPIMRGSVFTVVRDERRDLPVAMFNMRNIKSGTFKMSFNMVSEDTSDGIELEYFNEQTWSTDYVRYPMPGFEESVDPAQVSVSGITSTVQAQRETLYMVADAAYRRTTVQFDTELEGYLPCFGDLIAVAHDVPSWGLSGEFDRWDSGTRTARCTEDLTWETGTHCVMVISDQGDPIGPLTVTQGASPREIVFSPDVDIDLIYVGTDRERTRYAFGLTTTYAAMCKITGIKPADDNVVTITAALEDDQVHTADNALLPTTPGDGGTGTIPGGGRVAKYGADGLPNYDAASDSQRSSAGYYAADDLTVGSSHDPGYVYGH
jgi:putative tail protein